MEETHNEIAALSTVLFLEQLIVIWAVRRLFPHFVETKTSLTFRLPSWRHQSTNELLVQGKFVHADLIIFCEMFSLHDSTVLRTLLYERSCFKNAF